MKAADGIYVHMVVMCWSHVKHLTAVPPSAPLFAFHSTPALYSHSYLLRWGTYALYGSVDTPRYEVVVELFAIFTMLAADGQSRNELQRLKARALDMLTKLEEIGPLQEHTSVFHLIIELIVQAMRWGPPSVYWCYFLERFLGYLVRGIKSKRHAEASIMSRFRSTLVPRRALCRPRFESVDAELPQSAEATLVAEKFPTRARCGSHQLQPRELEDVHRIFLGLNRTCARCSEMCSGVL